MELRTLQDLYVEQLRDLYDAENQLIEALPKMAKAATLQDLQKAFNEHLNETRQHVSRLEQVFDHIGVSPKGEKCEAMKGLIKEGEQLMHKQAGEPVKDAGLIASAQRVEHYEIAGYGTVRTWARRLGRDDEASLLEQILKEESMADEKLTKIAENVVNAEAVS